MGGGDQSASQRIYLIRHGRCKGERTLLGASDPALSPEGRAECVALARRLRGEGISRIVSSGLRRARESAEVIAADLNLTVEVDARLNEISFGPWDGLTWAQIEDRFPEAAAAKLADWFHFTPAGGEPFREFLARIKQASESIWGAEERTTAVVAHLTVNAVLTALANNPGLSYADLNGPAGDRIHRFEQAHASHRVLDSARLGPGLGG